MKAILVFLFCAIFSVSAWSSENPTLSERARFSLLTCSPGADLYSLFGHSAIRLQDSIGGRWFDVVFNYGTFRFDEYFYMKFARGKLDYVLETSRYDDFISEYEYDRRGVWEQEILLTPVEKQKLFELLQENAREENCTYRYDFFYDNCSTRIRDMIMRCVSYENTEQLGFRYVPLHNLLQVNRIDFPYEFPEGRTYRQSIQTYLDYQPWSDLGIDLALGLPCDDVAGPFGLMFLPDSLMREFEYAMVDGQLLCAAPQQILMPTFLVRPSGFGLSPFNLFAALLLLQIVLTAVGKKSGPNMFDKLIVLIAGLVGVLVVFLWFFTDHTATLWNWNVLWANPLHLLILLFAKRFAAFARYYALAMIGMISLTIFSYPLLPQSFHPAAFPLMLMLIIAFVKYYRKATFTETNVVVL